MNIGNDVDTVFRLVKYVDYSVEEAAIIVSTARGKAALYADILIDGYWERIASGEAD